MTEQTLTVKQLHAQLVDAINEGLGNRRVVIALHEDDQQMALASVVGTGFFEHVQPVSVEDFVQEALFFVTPHEDVMRKLSEHLS